MNKKFYILIVILIFISVVIATALIAKVIIYNSTLKVVKSPVSQTNISEESSTTPTQIPNVSLTMTATPTLQPVFKPKTTGLAYGIAAGGVLTGLSQGDLDSYFSNLKELGVTWVRWDIDWNFVQPKSPNEFDWNGIDKVVQTAKRFGISSLTTIAYAPDWASQKPCSYPACVPSDPKAFGTFAGVVAERYKNSINAFEIWNEPNYPIFWTNPNADYYSHILREAYSSIKSVNPGATVLSGGLAAVENGQNGSGISPLTFLQELYTIGANHYFDGIALHPYTYPMSPNSMFFASHWQEMGKIRKLMNNNSDSAKKIWITEYGAATGGPGRAFNANEISGYAYGFDYMSEGAQAYFMQQATSLYAQNSSWFGPFFWYTLKDPSDNRGTTENFFGLIRSDGGKKPAFAAFQSAIGK